MIPSLSVNEMLGSITAAGESVQVRINGRESTIEQVRTLLPETIKRVEWIDNPGLRYGNANYVLNFIVSNPTMGGSFMGNAQPSVTQKFGIYNADVKLNVGRSQWQFGGSFKQTDGLRGVRDYIETFTYPDGTSLTRKEIPLDGTINNSSGDENVTYNYVKPDTTVVYVSLSLYHRFNDLEKYDGLMTLSDGSTDIKLTDAKGGNGVYPSFSAYLEQHFSRKQTLVVDFSSEYYFGKTYSDYIEQAINSSTYLSEIHTMIKDRNQAYNLEVNYIKNWLKSRLTAGARYTANRNRSVYENLDGSIYHQRQDKAYLFAEYYQRLNRFSVTAGIGAQYTDFMFRETRQGNHSWNLRPRASVTYRLNQMHQFRVDFTSWQTTPSLAQTNIAPQQIDGFQWSIGNPNLKTSNSYRLSFRDAFNFSIVSGTIGVKGFTSPNAIAPILRWDDEQLITTYENSNGLQQFTFYIAPQIEVVKDWVTVSAYVQYIAERMRGTGYKLYNHNWSGNGEIMVMHWGFMLSLNYNRASRNLYGEKITWGEDLNIIDLKYNWRNWQFGAGMLMAFGKYDQGSRQLNKWNTNEKHMRLEMSIPYVSISWNVQWGRQKRSTQKLIDSEASVDKSSIGSR